MTEVGAADAFGGAADAFGGAADAFGGGADAVGRAADAGGGAADAVGGGAMGALAMLAGGIKASRAWATLASIISCRGTQLI